jgi:hypothetical protein
MLLPAFDMFGLLERTDEKRHPTGEGDVYRNFKPNLPYQCRFGLASPMKRSFYRLWSCSLQVDPVCSLPHHDFIPEVAVAETTSPKLWLHRAVPFL